MKKILFSLGVMLSAFALTNCTQEIENPAQQPESAGYPFEIVASTVDTKTVNDGMHTKWAAKDTLNIFHAEAGATAYGTNDFFVISDTEEGRFKGNLTEAIASDKSYDWYVLYPYSRRITTPAATTAGYTYIGYSKGLNQTGYNSMASLKGSVCPLYGVAKAVAGSDMPSIEMNHISSVVAINVTNMNDEPLTITTASFTAPEDIVGSYYIDITKTPVECNPSGSNYVNSTAKVNVSNGTALIKGESAIIYAAIKPFTAKAGQKLTLSVNGYPKELTLPNDVTFSAGKIKTLNFAYDKVEEPTPEGATKATIVFAECGYANAASVNNQSIAIDENVTATFKKGTASTAPAYYDSGKAIRMYQNGATLDICSSNNNIISKIELTFADSQYYIAADSGELSAEADVRTWTGSASAVKFTSTGTDKNHRAYVSKISVTYVSIGETPEPEPEYTLDGKQWLLNSMDTYVLIDLGLYEEDAMVVALPAMDGSGFACYMYGAYEIEKTDAKSGKIIFTQYDPEWDEFMDPVEYAYSDLSESEVYVSLENIVGDPTPLPLVAVEEPYEIIFDNLGGGNEPSGAIENGEYWFFNGDKVMAPLAEGVTTGTLPAGNVISGASTEKNIFTLTYDPDWSYYTIQDSYGRYLGQTDETGNITVTDVLPTDDTYAFYLWCVETGYGDACSIYNAAYYYDITYSAANNNWVLVDGGYEFPETLPILVKAENPVEEPVVPEGPKVVTAAEFNAATDNSIEYQVSGTISGIYQAYNSSYNNISLYISDETGEILAFRVSCAGITDPANTLTKGDLITVKGKRTLYNEKPQMAAGGVIVSHTDVVVETPAGGATLSFANKANRTVFTTSQQVWEQNGVKLINDKGSSTSDVADYASPARFYKSSKLTVEYAGMTKIEFTCNNGNYATALKSSITTGTATVEGSVVTVELGAAADSYVISSLTGGQVRMDSITVYAN